MRVLGIISSPRKPGNSELAAKEILKQFPDSWEKMIFNLNDLDINSCRACYACVPYGSKCRIKDDFEFVVRMIKHADKVVIAAPTYMLGGHTGIKRVLDRLISLTSDSKRFRHSDCVLAISYGYRDWYGLSKEDLILFARKFHLNVIGTAMLKATLPGDSVKGENLEKLHKLADILQHGIDSLPEPSGKELECPLCSGTALQIMPSARYRCAVCGGTGSLEFKDGGVSLLPDEDCYFRFSDEALNDHLDFLEEKKQLFLDTRSEIKKLQEDYNSLNWWVSPADLD